MVEELELWTISHTVSQGSFSKCKFSFFVRINWIQLNAESRTSISPTTYCAQYLKHLTEQSSVLEVIRATIADVTNNTQTHTHDCIDSEDVVWECLHSADVPLTWVGVSVDTVVGPQAERESDMMGGGFDWDSCREKGGRHRVFIRVVVMSKFRCWLTRDLSSNEAWLRYSTLQNQNFKGKWSKPQLISGEEKFLPDAETFWAAPTPAPHISTVYLPDVENERRRSGNPWNVRAATFSSRCHLPRQV